MHTCIWPVSQNLTNIDTCYRYCHQCFQHHKNWQIYIDIVPHQYDQQFHKTDIVIKVANITKTAIIINAADVTKTEKYIQILQLQAVFKMKIWINYWSESNSWIYFYIVLNKNWKIYWSQQSLTGLGTDQCSSWRLTSTVCMSPKVTK